MNHNSTTFEAMETGTTYTGSKRGTTIGEGDHSIDYSANLNSESLIQGLQPLQSAKEYFFIKQMPSIARIAGALEMPRKSFLYY
jgi:hypothetical protein